MEVDLNGFEVFMLFGLAGITRLFPPLLARLKDTLWGARVKR